MHLKKGIRTITVSHYQHYGSFDSKGAISSEYHHCSAGNRTWTIRRPPPTFHCWTTDHMFNSVTQTLFGEMATVLQDLITSP